MTTPARGKQTDAMLARWTAVEGEGEEKGEGDVFARREGEGLDQTMQQGVR